MSSRPHIGFFLVILLIAAITVQWMYMSVLSGPLQKNPNSVFPEISCSTECPQRIVVVDKVVHSSETEECPEYFKWIHEDLQPWKVSGITREMVERARKVAHFRVIVVSGVLYVEKYKQAFQTRDMVTLWGILQLLTLYPGRIPDLDLMFECGDLPVIKKRVYDTSKHDSAPPPLFHYCGDDSSFDIVFPDWSFWGWPELKIKPWEILKKEMQESNEMRKWEDREPSAYWKGNIKLSIARRDLVKCNATDKQERSAHIYVMDWHREKKQGFQTSELVNQCTHRYKIYVEGVSWSVSLKYILACDSMSLIIRTRYYDFFTRSLVPTIHYWPINEKDKCRSIKYAVDWGNTHPKEAKEIGKAGSNYVQETIRMKYVYDYMFHLLQEYAKLLKYQPSVPKGAVEVCREAMICSVKGVRKKFRLNSMVINASESSGPCSMPPPYYPPNLRAFLKRKRDVMKHIEIREAANEDSRQSQL